MQKTPPKNVEDHLTESSRPSVMKGFAPGERAPIMGKIGGHQEYYSRRPYNGGQWGTLLLLPLLWKSMGVDPNIKTYKGIMSKGRRSITFCCLCSSCPYNGSQWENEKNLKNWGASRANPSIDLHYGGPVSTALHAFAPPAPILVVNGKM